MTMDNDQRLITALLSFDCERAQVKDLYERFRMTLGRIGRISSARMPNAVPDGMTSFLPDSNRHLFTSSDGAQDHDVSWLHAWHGGSTLRVHEFGTTNVPTEITLHGNMERDPSNPASPPERDLSCTRAVERIRRLGELLTTMLAERMSDDMPDESVAPIMEEALRLAKAAAASRSARTGQPAYARCAGPFSRPGLFDVKPMPNPIQPAEYVPVVDAVGIETRFMHRPRTVNAIIQANGETDIAPVSAYVDASRCDPMELLRMIEDGSR